MMRVFVLAVMMGVMVFGYDVVLQKNFTKEVIPKRLSVRLNVTTDAKVLQEVMQTLDTFTKSVTNFKGVKVVQNGFNTAPQYSYKNNMRKKAGYRGSVNFDVSSEKKENLEAFINHINTIQNKNLDIYLSSKKWNIDSKTKEQTKQELSIEAIKWAKHYAETLSHKLDDRCKLKKVDFVKGVCTVPVKIAQGDTVTKKEIPLAKKEKRIISINAILKYECR